MKGKILVKESNGTMVKVPWRIESCSQDGACWPCQSEEGTDEIHKDYVHYRLSDELAAEFSKQPPQGQEDSGPFIPSSKLKEAAVSHSNEPKVTAQQAGDPEVMEQAWRNALIVEGERVEYFSRTHGAWVPAQVSVDVSWKNGEPVLRYDANILQGSRKEDVAEDHFRRPLRDEQLVEVYRPKGAGTQTLFTYSRQQQRDKDIMFHLQDVHENEFKELSDIDWKDRLCLINSEDDELTVRENIPEDCFPVTVQLREFNESDDWIPGVIHGRLPNIGASLGYPVLLHPGGNRPSPELDRFFCADSF